MVVELTVKTKDICNTFVEKPIKVANKVFLFKPMIAIFSFKGKLGDKVIKKQFDLWEEACEWIRNADFTTLTFEGVSYGFGFTSPVVFELCKKAGDECKLHVPAKITTNAQYAPTRERFIKSCSEFVYARFHELPNNLPVHIADIDDFYLVYPLRQDELGEIDYYNVKVAKKQFALEDIIDEEGNTIFDNMNDHAENNSWLNKIRKWWKN